MKTTILQIRFWLLAALSAVLLLACGQGASVEERVAGARKRNDGPAIWKITDLDSTLYLYGTVHLLPDDMDWQRNDLNAAFGEVGTIYFEIPDDAEANLQATLLQQQYGLYDSGERLTDYLDNSNLNRLTAALHNVKLPREQIIYFKPWLVADILSLAAAEADGLKPENSADAVLRARAARDGKVVKYLDDMRTYVEAVALLPDYIQLQALEATIKDFDNVGADIRTVNGAWIVGNTDLLERDVVMATRDKSPEMYDVLFTKRNAKWTRTLDDFLQGDSNAMAVVGIGHLLGDDGLPFLLRELGYDVERVRRYDIPNN
jgi:uncharacterized protein YbaP (TraB family)